jgi:hypothetical protein
MTKDEIIELARQAGLHIATDVNWMPIIGLEYLERFAKLVAEAERDACAKIADELQLDYAHDVAMEIRARGQE